MELGTVELVSYFWGKGRGVRGWGGVFCWGFKMTFLS